jgi:hypothetical protein
MASRRFITSRRDPVVTFSNVHAFKADRLFSTLNQAFVCQIHHREDESRGRSVKSSVSQQVS